MTEPAGRWITIPRWDGPDGFQHYRDRDPIWIKAYTRLLSDDTFLSLTYHQRGLLLSIWLEYARSGRRLRDKSATDTRQTRDSHMALSRQLGHRVTTRDLEALNHAGYIEFAASAPLATGYQPASPEKEKEKERSSRARARQTTTNSDTPPPDRSICPICTVNCTRDWKLLEHLEHVHDLRGSDAFERAGLEALSAHGGV